MTGRPVRIRLGMVGGGQGGFIGAVHRMAAQLDDRYEFCAAALSSDPQRAVTSARELGLAEDRGYAHYEQMIAAEKDRDDGVEAVAIVTPNHLHHPIAKACLTAGMHVICDKPMTMTVEEAVELNQLAASTNRILAVTYNYSGYPMVRQAREMIAQGDLGRIRVVQGEYAQEWLAENIEADGHKQAVWRTDPEKSGAGGCIGDIGTHIYQLINFTCGLTAESLCAELSAFVDGRRLDDNANILLRFTGGARGSIWASQVAPGHANGLQIRIYGEKGSLRWHQEEPDELLFAPLGRPLQILNRNSHAIGDAANRVSRIPSGHPEGYLEAFATIYTEIAAAINALNNGEKPAAAVTFPTGKDGEDGMRFVHAAVESSNAGAKWVDV